MSMLRTLLRRPTADPQAALDRLSRYGVEQDLIDRLGRLIFTAPESQLYRANGFFWVDQLELPVRRGLSLLAASVVGGIVDLNWESCCPHCGGQGPAFESLSVARRQQTCAACEMSYEAALDQQIVVTFSPNSTIRPVAASADDPAWRSAIDQRYGHMTGHDLLTVQAFRDLFINEALPRGESFQVLRLALLFTDLGGSTALYTEKGDPRAYGLVREHFNMLFRIVDEAGGATVKTIGDAVMAVFPQSGRALSAALEAQRAVAAFNRENALDADEALQLKAGIHAGPCLAVTLNERLDYFGTTVNAAARVQKQARVGEVVFTSEVFGDLADPAGFGVRDLAAEPLTLRGLDDQVFHVYRLLA